MSKIISINEEMLSLKCLKKKNFSSSIDGSTYLLLYEISISGDRKIIDRNKSHRQ
jgi:hypothetical protein